jgi:dihydrofolate reductase
VQLSLIVAAAENGVIGRDGALPWRLPDDLKRFKQLTLGHPIVMGRKTWESIGRPLPGRLNIVVTRQHGYAADGCRVVASLQDALAVAREAGTGQAFVIGGADLYNLALPLADCIHLTRVLAEVEGDTRLPNIPWPEFERVDAESHVADERHEHAFVFETWRRCGHLAS